ncbi:MAG: class I SAM-dependent methyltransferase [Chloroflexota bacterium]
MSALKWYGRRIATGAESAYRPGIVGLAKSLGTARALDVGCGYSLASGIADTVYGVDVDPGTRTTVLADISQGLPFVDGSFDLVYSNQVIEHVPDVDSFMKEIIRVTRTEGYVVICTENIAAWHNIAACILGWQPFSSANCSSVRWTIGNPASVWNIVPVPHLRHRTLFSLRGLRDFVGVYGCAGVISAGWVYFPFPQRFWASLSRLDPHHSTMIAVAGQKLKDG